LKSGALKSSPQATEINTFQVATCESPKIKPKKPRPVPALSKPLPEPSGPRRPLGMKISRTLPKPVLPAVKLRSPPRILPPYKLRSPSPVTLRTFPTSRMQSPSPGQTPPPDVDSIRTPSPPVVRRRTPAPIRKRALPPVRSRYAATLRMQTPSVSRMQTPSVSRMRAVSPIREQTPPAEMSRSPTPVLDPPATPGWVDSASSSASSDSEENKPLEPIRKHPGYVIKEDDPSGSTGLSTCIWTQFIEGEGDFLKSHCEQLGDLVDFHIAKEGQPSEAFISFRTRSAALTVKMNLLKGSLSQGSNKLPQLIKVGWGKTPGLVDFDFSNGVGKLCSRI